MFVPREMFLSKGVGQHKARLASFEWALRDAGIAQFNLVSVSSIFPPHCPITPREKGLGRAEAGGEYGEDLAASMLATVLGVEFDINAAWDARREVFRISGRIVRTKEVTQSAVGQKDAWTTTI